MADRPPHLAVPGDIAEALALLTRLPLPHSLPNRGARAAWAWPLAGLVVGTLAAATGFVALALGLPPGLAAGLVVAASIAATGALHEDGLADTADGFWGGWTRERRLEIMKDSRIGSYGVIALILSLGLRWVAVTALLTAGSAIAVIVATAVLSRLPMVLILHALPNARGEGLSARTGRPDFATVLLATGIALAIGGIALGPATPAAILVLILSTVAVAAIMRSKIGGQTGDTLGASQQVAEISLLAAFVATA
ncbi:MAG: adenosylcobinamide-GDP ribazoletransferase [Rhodobacter sp.]|nr:adenosylcobinamide-GDP ribazoletransferase [Rhodobacter sp.]